MNIDWHKIKLSKIVYSTILVLFFALVTGIFVWAVSFLSRAVNTAVDENVGQEVTLTKLNLVDYNLLAEKLGLPPARIGAPEEQDTPAVLMEADMLSVSTTENTVVSTTVATTTPVVVEPSSVGTTTVTSTI